MKPAVTDKEKETKFFVTKATKKYYYAQKVYNEYINNYYYLETNRRSKTKRKAKNTKIQIQSKRITINYKRTIIPTNVRE